MANERRAQREKNVEVFLGRVFVISGVYCLSCPWALLLCSLSCLQFCAHMLSSL